jgi:ketosteroid isomerase-like protein
VDDAHRVVEDYWRAANTRDWAAFVALVAENVVYEAPQTRERVRGRQAYRRFNSEGFPGHWQVTVVRIVGEGRHAASWIEMADGGDHYYGVCFFDMDESGRIVRITDFWPTPTEVPASRAYLVERY